MWVNKLALAHHRPICLDLVPAGVLGGEEGRRGAIIRRHRAAVWQTNICRNQRNVLDHVPLAARLLDVFMQNRP